MKKREERSKNRKRKGKKETERRGGQNILYLSDKYLLFLKFI